MPRVRETHGERRRRAILDAAADVSTAAGLEGLSIGGLAREVGLSKSGLAAHFEKQGIALLSIEAGTGFFVEELGSGGEGVERVVLAAPSFPRTTHRLTFATGGSEAGEPDARIAPALVSDLALRLGHALKPMHTMRTYLEDFVISKLSPSARSTCSSGTWSGLRPDCGSR